MKLYSTLLLVSLLSISPALSETIFNDQRLEQQLNKRSLYMTELTVFAVTCQHYEINWKEFFRLYDIPKYTGENSDKAEQIKLIEEATFNTYSDINNGHIEKDRLCDQGMKYYGTDGSKEPGIIKIKPTSD